MSKALVHGATKVAAAALVSPGDWLSGAQRRSAWIEARDAATNELDQARKRAISPNAVDGHHPPTDELPSAAVEVVHRIASDPGRLSRSWADDQIAALGDAVYTELVGVTAVALAVDTFDRSVGADERSIGPAAPGEPTRIRPGDVGEVGAWVPQALEGARANVSRSISLVPETQRIWGQLVDALYSRGQGFYDLSWDRALTRPQVEAVAARTTAELECFY